MEEGSESLLHLIPDTRIVDALRTKWSASSRSSEEKWMDLKTQVKKYDKGSTHRVCPLLSRTPSLLPPNRIILQYNYPHLDAEASKCRNHLLKAPFCVHPKMGRVCVPVDPKRIEEFEPGEGQLLRELDASGSADIPSGKHHSGACVCVSSDCGC